MNHSVPVQQPNVKISEVNTKQYQKPKKVAVNEADKYNLNHDVHDYDIYENQVWKLLKPSALRIFINLCVNSLESRIEIA